MENWFERPIKGGDFMASPLMLDGWVAFNEHKWGVKAKRRTFLGGSSELPRADALFYENHKGKFVFPSLNPYMAIHFESTGRQPTRHGTQEWLNVAEHIVDEMKEFGVEHEYPLPPGIIDARPWTWAGTRVNVKYTLLVDFPYDVSTSSKRVRRAEKNGYRVERTLNMSDVFGCLQETAARKGFEQPLSPEDLKIAANLLGEEHFRGYVCYDASGTPASAMIMLHQPGEWALAWVMGTREEHLSSGAAQYLYRESFADLYQAGARGLDLVGANIRGVADAKMEWNPQLVPYFVVGPTTMIAQTKLKISNLGSHLGRTMNLGLIK